MNTQEQTTWFHSFQQNIWIKKKFKIMEGDQYFSIIGGVNRGVGRT